jgi:hypothetical protein
MKAPKNSRGRTLRLYSPSLAILCVLIPFFSYYMKQVKVQEGYQNDRAFRVLDLIARQFNGEIDGTHQTMDASLRVQGKAVSERNGPANRCPQDDDLIAIRRYLKAYVTDKFTPEGGEPIPLAGETAEQRVCEAVDAKEVNEPRHSHAIVQFQDSRIYLELSHEGVAASGRKVRIRIFLDPAKMLARTLKDDRSAIFDTVFAGSLEATGDVLAQKSNPQVNVVVLDTLLKSGRLHRAIEGDSSSKGSDDGKLGATPDLSTAVSGANQRFDVQVSGTDYVLFVAPAPFELDDERPSTQKKNNPTRIAFYGLVRKESLAKQALGLPDLALPAIMLTLFACLAFLWPPLKLYTMSDRERLGKASVANICLLGFLGYVFMGTLVLSFGLYRTLCEEEDPRLQALANAIHTHLVAELKDGLEAAAVVRCLYPEHSGETVPFRDLPKKDFKARDQLMEKYPFFKHLILTNRSGGDGAANDQQQIFKITANVIPTPLIPLPEADFPFIGRLELNPSIIDRQPFALQSFVSPNTGEFLPIVTFPPGRNQENDTLTDSMRIILTTELPSLVNTIFPRGYGFALIDPDGTVQFHSDPARNLKENFFSECDDIGELRKWMLLGEKAHFNLNYGGQSIRAFVQPLGDMDENFGLTLIVFSRFSEKARLVTAIGRSFLLTVGGLMLVCGILAASYRFLRWRPEYTSTIAYLRHRLWPRDEDKGLYALEGAWCVVCFLCAFTIVLLGKVISNIELLLAMLAGLWLLCCAGLSTWVHEKVDVVFLLKKCRLNSRLKTFPVSAAYATVIFAAILGVIGILFLFVFQGCIYRAQKEEGRDAKAYYAERLKARGDRIRAALHARNPEAGREAISTERRKSFDLYEDEFQPANPAPIRVIPAYTPVGTSEAEISSGLWPALPAIDWNCLLQLYLPSLLLLAAIFVWLYQVGSRLFFLDFRQPERLTRSNPQELAERIKSAFACGRKTISHLLVFAHPHSGTSEMIGALIRSMGVTGCLASADEALIDFSQLGAVSEWSTPKSCAAAAETAKRNRLVILDNFEYGLQETESRRGKLALLEAIVYSHGSSVYIFTSSDPILLVQSLVNEDPDDQALQSELAGWTRVLSSFEPLIYSDSSIGAVLTQIKRIKSILLSAKPPLKEDERKDMVEMATREFTSTIFLRRMAKTFDTSRLNLRKPHLFEESLIHLVRQQADRQYRALWMNCTSDERLALYQLAKDSWLNPQNRLAISHLLRKNLITQNSSRKNDGPYYLMNVSFRSFVVETVTQYELDIWRAQQNLSLWPAVRMALGTIVIVLAGFLFYVQRTSFDAYFGYLAVLAGGGTALVRIIVQFFTKANPTLADLIGGGGSKGESGRA